MDPGFRRDDDKLIISNEFTRILQKIIELEIADISNLGQGFGFDQSGKKIFVSKTLPQETVDYVPKILAAIIVGRNSDRF